MTKYKFKGWYCSDGEHRGFFTEYKYETIGQQEVIPLYEKVGEQTE